jgi:hypothetical protein
VAAGLRHELDRPAADLVTSRTRRLGLALGVAAGALYIAVTALGQGAMPARLLFDGFAPPQPYRWVSPPSQFAGSNQPALAARGTVALTADGSESVSLATGDGQAYFIAAKGAFPAREGQSSIAISITPQNPDRLGSPPGGLAPDGNAYTFEASYQPSGEDATPVTRVSVVLRYPIHATLLLRRSGDTWTRIETITVPASLEVFANTTQLGTFVAAAPTSSSPHRWILYFSIGAIVLAAVAGLVVRVRIRRRSGQPWQPAAEARARAAGSAPPGIPEGSTSKPDSGRKSERRRKRRK